MVVVIIIVIIKIIELVLDYRKYIPRKSYKNCWVIERYFVGNFIFLGTLYALSLIHSEIGFIIPIFQMRKLRLWSN